MSTSKKFSRSSSRFVLHQVSRDLLTLPNTEILKIITVEKKISLVIGHLKNMQLEDNIRLISDSTFDATSLYTQLNNCQPNAKFISSAMDCRWDRRKNSPFWTSSTTGVNDDADSGFDNESEQPTRVHADKLWRLSDFQKNLAKGDRWVKTGLETGKYWRTRLR
jgi:hypothetical protein